MSQDIRARKTQLVKQLSSYSLQELKALWKKTVGPGGSNKTKVQLQEGIITHYLQVWDKETKELAHKELKCERCKTASPQMRLKSNSQKRVHKNIWRTKFEKCAKLERGSAKECLQC